MLNMFLRLHYCEDHWLLSQRGVIHAAHALTVDVWGVQVGETRGLSRFGLMTAVCSA